MALCFPPANKRDQSSNARSKQPSGRRNRHGRKQVRTVVIGHSDDLAFVVDASRRTEIDAAAQGDQAVQVLHRALAPQDGMVLGVAGDVGATDDLPARVDTEGIAFGTPQSPEVLQDPVAVQERPTRSSRALEVGQTYHPAAVVDVPGVAVSAEGSDILHAALIVEKAVNRRVSCGPRVSDHLAGCVDRGGAAVVPA